jgi:alpha-tubulin suppressor-like RCC1 family protein
VYGQQSMIPSARDEGAVEDHYTYVSVSAGANHTCGLRTTGNIRCWGSDLHNQATPPGANDELRVNDVGVGDFTAVSAGDSHTCGLRQGGAVVCWGQNTYGQASPR